MLRGIKSRVEGKKNARHARCRLLVQEWASLQQATVLQATSRCVFKGFGKEIDHSAHVDELGQCIIRVADLDAARNELLSDEICHWSIVPTLGER